MLTLTGSWVEEYIKKFHIILATFLYIENYYKIKRFLEITPAVVSEQCSPLYF